MKTIWTGPLSEVDEEIGKFLDDMGMIDEVVEHGDNDEYAIMRYRDYFIEVTELGIVLYEGMCLRKDYMSNTYEPDFDITLIYGENDEPEYFLYWEQGGFISTCSNYFNTKYSVSEILGMKCKLIINE